jgi:nucleolar protein 16
MSTCPRFLTFWKKREKTTELDFDSASPHERGPRRPHNREQQARMPRSQKSNRRRSTIVKVKNKPKGIGKAVGKRVGRSQRFQGSALDYNEKESQFTNYARLGLMADANQIGAVKETITGFKPIKHVPAATGGAAAAVGSTAGGVHQLELEVPEGLVTIRPVPAGERIVLLKLMAKHGTDYAAMARDTRLNALQHTAAHLRKRIAKLTGEDAEDGVESTSAAAEPAVPAPRHRPKVTKQPNNAFHKRSMHFN